MTATATGEWEMLRVDPVRLVRLFGVRLSSGRVVASLPEFRYVIPPGVFVRDLFADTEVALDADEIAEREGAVKEQLAQDDAVVAWLKVAGEVAALESRKRDVAARLVQLDADEQHALQECPDLLPGILAEKETAATDAKHVDGALAMLGARLREARGPAVAAAMRAYQDFRKALVKAFADHEDKLLDELETALLSSGLLPKLVANAQRRNWIIDRGSGQHERLLDALINRGSP